MNVLLKIERKTHNHTHTLLHHRFTVLTNMTFVTNIPGIPRLVQLCKEPEERNHSDPVLVACLVRTVVVNTVVLELHFNHHVIRLAHPISTIYMIKISLIMPIKILHVVKANTWYREWPWNIAFTKYKFNLIWHPQCCHVKHTMLPCKTYNVAM